VGNTTIVQLWPEQPDLESGDRGVLVRTAAQLYLVGYHAGRWRYRKVNRALGGTGPGSPAAARAISRTR
jgi:hypothetical protein